MSSNQSSTPMNSEPVITVTVITTAVAAILSVLVQAGLPISQGLQDSLQGLIIALYPIVTVLWARQKVYAPDTVQKLKAEQYNAGHRVGSTEATTGTGRFQRPNRSV